MSWSGPTFCPTLIWVKTVCKGYQQKTLVGTFFLSKSTFLKILSRIPSECQTVWIQIRPNFLSGLIWAQTVCKGYQQTTLVGTFSFKINFFKNYFMKTIRVSNSSPCSTVWACLATDVCLTADPGVASSILARSHTFVEIDHEIILLPLAEWIIQELQEKVCARSTG